MTPDSFTTRRIRRYRSEYANASRYHKRKNGGGKRERPVIRMARLSLSPLSMDAAA